MWKTLYATIAADARYHQLLGKAGSTPLDLFKLKVDELAEALHVDKRVAADMVHDGHVTLASFDEFAAQLAASSRGQSISAQHLPAIYRSLLRRAQEREDRERKRKRSSRSRSPSVEESGEEGDAAKEARHHHRHHHKKHKREHRKSSKKSKRSKHRSRDGASSESAASDEEGK